MKIAISGGTGFIGSHLVTNLSRSGHELTLLQRGLRQNDLHELIHFDLDDSSAFDFKKLKGTDVVIHLAACVHDASFGLADHMRRNYKATKALYSACRIADVKKFIFLSTVGVYGKHHSTTPLYVDSPVEPKTPYALSKLEAERYLLSQKNSGPISSIIRLPLVYGNNAPGNIMLLTKLIKTLRVSPFVGFDNRRSIIDVEDVCDVLLQMCENIELHPGLQLIAGPKPISTHQLTERIAHDIDVSMIRVSVPKSLFKLTFKTLRKGSVYNQICGDLVFQSSI